MLVGDVETRDALVRAVVERIDEEGLFAELTKRRASRRRRRVIGAAALAAAVLVVVGVVAATWPNTTELATSPDSSKAEVPRFLPGFLPEGVAAQRYSGSFVTGRPVTWNALYVRAGTTGPITLRAAVYPVDEDRLPGSGNDEAVRVNGRPGVLLGNVKDQALAWSVAPGLQGWVSGTDQDRDVLTSVATSVKLRDDGPAFDAADVNGLELRWQGIDPRLGDGKYLFDYSRSPYAERSASIGVSVSRITRSDRVLPLDALLAQPGGTPLTIRGKPAVAIHHDLPHGQWAWEERPGVWITLDFSGEVDDATIAKVADGLHEVDQAAFNRAISLIPQSSPATSTIPARP